MDRFRDRPLHPSANYERMNPFGLHRHDDGDISPDTSEFRQFAFQPVLGAHKQPFGCEARFRASWDDEFGSDTDLSARIMIDNWLLFGLDELNEGRPVFLSCTRDTLMSGLLSLLPPRSAVFEISESIEPDTEVLSMCRSLKLAGYRLALADFGSAENIYDFLPLADFIKVDFRHSGRRERASMLRRLRLTPAALIAESVQCEEELQQAREQGFGLFQGYYFGERISFVKKRDRLDPIHCTRILEALQEAGPAVDELAESINLESGIQARLIRHANWVTPSNVAINSTLEAIEVVEKSDIQRIVMLAMGSAASGHSRPRSANHHRNPMKNSADTLVRWNDAGARSAWWFSAGRGRRF